MNQRTIYSLMLLLVALMFAMTGCAGFQTLDPGGVGNTAPMGVKLGTLVGDVTFPNYVGSEVRFNIDSDDFTILKTVTAEASSHNILGLVSSGDTGYGALWREALAIGADDVINIKVDTRCQRYVGFLYTATTVKLTGLAIKYNR